MTVTAGQPHGHRQKSIRKGFHETSCFVAPQSALEIFKATLNKFPPLMGFVRGRGQVSKNYFVRTLYEMSRSSWKSRLPTLHQSWSWDRLQESIYLKMFCFKLYKISRHAQKAMSAQSHPLPQWYGCGVNLLKTFC